MKSVKAVVNLAYVEWGSRNRDTSLREALRCVSSAGAELGHLVIVDNKLECKPLVCSQARKTTVLPGDNRAREFSAWDVAYAALDPAVNANVLLFVNDTFSAHRRARLSRLIRIARWLNIVARSPDREMFGPLDPFSDKPVQWMFGTLSQYISSYIFGMSPLAAEALFPLCQIDEQLDTLLAPRFSPAGLFTDELPQEYQEQISNWLLVPGNWRNAASLSEENFSFFRLKAKSVLYEYALTSRATAAGIIVSDLFAGRTRIDRLIGRSAKWWIQHATLSRYPWLTALSSRSLRHSGS